MIELIDGMPEASPMEYSISLSQYQTNHLPMAHPNPPAHIKWPPCLSCSTHVMSMPAHAPLPWPKQTRQ